MLDGLRWLVRHQNADGSWSPTTLHERCACEDPLYVPKKAYTSDFDEGLTGMALLCFLGAGFGPESKQDIVDTALSERHKIGDVVRSGLEWLVARQGPNGSFEHNRAFMYNEALACAALCEAFALQHEERWKEPAQKAIDFLEGAQRPNPNGTDLWGWRYASRQEVESFRSGDVPDRETFDADSSCTGWCMMALRSGVRAGLDVHPQNLAGGLAFAKWVSTDDGRAGYLDPKGAGATVTGINDHFVYHPATMSALAMCIRMDAEPDVVDPYLPSAAKVITQDLPTISKDLLSIDYYYWHWATVALHDFDGPDALHKTNTYWGPWNKSMIDVVLSLQDHTERDCRNGGWLVPDRWSYDGGPLYTTAMNVLTLEVYYRYEAKKR